METTQLVTSEITDVTYSVGTGMYQFNLVLSDNVQNQCWKTWTYFLFLADGSELQFLSEMNEEGYDPDIRFESEEYYFTVESETKLGTVPLEVRVSTDSKTVSQTHAFNVHLEYNFNDGPRL